MVRSFFDLFSALAAGFLFHAGEIGSLGDLGHVELAVLVLRGNGGAGLHRVHGHFAGCRLFFGRFRLCGGLSLLGLGCFHGRCSFRGFGLRGLPILFCKGRGPCGTRLRGGVLRFRLALSVGLGGLGGLFGVLWFLLSFP